MGMDVGAKALRQRRIELRSAADALMQSEVSTDVPTVCLLLFYSAECGLKERLIRRGNHMDTTGIPEHLHHDLRKLAKNLRIGGAIDLRALDRCRRHGRQDRVEVRELHEAWRYGVRIRTEDQALVSEVLRSLITWCEKDAV